MRKFQQQQMLDVIQSLCILYSIIKDKLKDNAFETVQVALADCQEVTIQIFRRILR